MKHLVVAAMLGLVLAGGALAAPEVVLPNARNAYYASEAIELAVAGLNAGDTATVAITPDAKTSAGLQPMKLAYKGGDTALVLPPYSLAPGHYTISIEGGGTAPLTVSGGVQSSTMLVAQTVSVDREKEAGGNFFLGNSLSWGVLDGKGMPDTDPRGKKSIGFRSFEGAIEADLPTVCYLYWTGYVTHKPFGQHKSWASPQEIEAMRLLSFSNGQRMRRMGPNIVAVGPLDEPGLAWGKTPAGGFSSGFPNWDEQQWYEQHGWKYTQDITAGSDADWMKYLSTRCKILGEAFGQAKDDLKASWPKLTYSGDLYAVGVVMDGTDTLNQRVNDFPTTHIFFDFFGGPFAVIGQLYMEKAADPAAHIAHAMNGQLIGEKVLDKQRPLYHFLMNSMLSAGLHSNWWLNFAGMTPADLTAVNEPAARLGPVFINMAPTNHDIALLWSFSELAMRQKVVEAAEAKSTTGSQIKLMVPIPDEAEIEMSSSPYEVGANFQREITDVHQVIRRAGFAPHIVDDRLLKEQLPHYKVLVINGQTVELPPESREAIETFVKGGGGGEEESAVVHAG
jgi:hypothetical protein